MINSLERDKDTMISTLSITHNCNLGCTYCYAGKKTPEGMSFETAKKAVDFSFGIASDNEAIAFGFFGGEPLLKFDLMRKIVAYIRKRELTEPREVSLHVTTNGTLITPGILSYLKDEDIGLCISMDGPQHIHDQVRRYKNGRSSFDRIVENLKISLTALDKFQVNAVYTPNSLRSLREIVRFFVNLEVPLIHVNPDIQADWQFVSPAELKTAYEAVANLYIENFCNGQEIAVNLIDSKIIVFLKGGYDCTDQCGMGEREWGIAASGNIYPCERFVGEDNGNGFCMGNVSTGLNSKSRCEIVNQRGNRNKECARCSVQKYCMNWCGCTNYSMTGKTNLASSFLCASEKASMGAAQLVLSSLKDNTLFTNHYYQYLVKDHIPLAMVN
jgi:uncharacterized protein